MEMFKTSCEKAAFVWVSFRFSVVKGIGGNKNEYKVLF
jgi:hypothetical protein